MKSVPRFLTLLSFLLLLGTGCAASRTSVVTKTIQAPTPTKTKPVAKKSLKPQDSEYEELVTNSPLASYMRGEPMPEQGRKPKGPIEFVCVPTGDFNIAPDLQELRMRIWCDERHPPDGHSGLTKELGDKSFPRLEGKANLYPIPYEKAFIKVVEMNGALKVLLHYRDDDGEIRKITLPKQEWWSYSFSLGGYATKLQPLGTIKTFEVK